MCIETRKHLAILAACKSGLVTVHQNYENMTPWFGDKIKDTDKALTRAIKLWFPSKHEEQDTNLIIQLLKIWRISLKQSGLYIESNMGVMVAMSLQAVIDLAEHLED